MSAVLGVSYYDGTDEILSSVTYYDGVQELTGETTYVPYGYPSVSDMMSHNPFYVAHRGGSIDWPEMSLYAYTHSADWGAQALEVSCSPTSDGVWVGCHNQTLAEITGNPSLTTPITDMTWSQIQQYANNSGASGHPQPIMRLEEVLNAYGKSHTFFLDPKYGIGKINSFNSLVASNLENSTERVVMKFSGVLDAYYPNIWNNLGYETWGYFYQADYENGNLSTYQAPWSILGMDYTANAAAWTATMGYGKPVIGHICPNSSAVATAVSFGASGVMCSSVLSAIPKINQ